MVDVACSLSYHAYSLYLKNRLGLLRPGSALAFLIVIKVLPCICLGLSPESSLFECLFNVTGLILNGKIICLASYRVDFIFYSFSFSFNLRI